MFENGFLFFGRCVRSPQRGARRFSAPNLFFGFCHRQHSQETKPKKKDFRSKPNAKKPSTIIAEKQTKLNL